MTDAQDTTLEAERINLFDPQTLINPYPAYKAMRDAGPAYYVPEMNMHVITRYDIIRQAIKDTETFSSAFDGFLMETQRLTLEAAAPEIQMEVGKLAQEMVEIPPTMLTMDEPGHTMFRSLVSKLFTASQIKAGQSVVQNVIDTAIGGMDGLSEADFIECFAGPVPLTIIGDRLGIPEKDREFFNTAATSAAASLRLTPASGEEIVHRAKLALDLQKLLIRLVDETRQEPQDTMISILANSKLEEEDRLLSYGEIISILNQFLVAGHETTVSTFGWGMLFLCRQPELQEELRGNEKAIKTFVEETLRMESPIQGLPRIVTKDTDLEGYPLKAGDVVMLRYGAANRDEKMFADPDVCNIHREKVGAQLAFGSGIHFCIGAPLARQELTLGFKTLLDTYRNFRLNDDMPVPEAEPSFMLHNLPHLHIRFDKA